MKKSMLFILAIITIGFSYPDLVCPLSWRYLRSNASGFIDTFEIHSYLQNRGDQTAISPLYPDPYMAVIIGVDSFNIRSQKITSLNAGYFLEFVDTISVIAAPFSVHSHCDPIGGTFQGLYNGVNDVFSYSINIHPTIHYDTITLVHYDTVTQNYFIHDTTRIKDTLRITTQIHDTIKIVTQIRDTIIKADTIRIVRTDTLTKKDTIRITRIDTVFHTDTLKVHAGKFAKAVTPRKKVYGEIYNIIGQKIWSGEEYEGILPRIKYSQGTHIFIQGNKKKLFKIVY